ncbi:MAG: hypothetical protein MAG431_01112 [Chloroflexi bacterium]|nr:hypothetical protein [Chloroflexota bacterium]
MKLLKNAAIILTITLLLSGCGSLSEDIASPAVEDGDPAGTIPTATAPPPTPEISPTEDSAGPESAPDPSPTTGSSPAEEVPGIVEVEVLSSEGETLPDGLEVSLFGYDHMTQVYEDALTLPAEGVARFEEAPFLDGRLFFAEIIHEGASYRSSIVEASADSPALNLQVEILGTTTDTSSLVVDRMHVFLDFSQPEILGVGEIFIVSNMGNQTVVAEEAGEPVLSLALPPQAVNLQFQDGQLGGRYIETEDGFADTLDIMPGSGSHQVMVSFDVPYPKKNLEISQVLSYPTGAAVVLLEDGMATITSSQLEDVGTQQTETGLIRVYASQQMKAGSTLAFTVTNPNAGPEISRTLLIGLAVLGVVLLAGGAWLYFRSRGNEEPDKVATPHDRDELLDTIIALDDLYENGEIDSTVYHQRRGELKAQLAEAVGDK